ncbi:unnamed protein product [Spirodela intermedia]|uniref:Uncharacterized protein n=1 Tax=Spirodela intermedia TaxID=51605 RepID=A0A7I8KAR0_SPIIN|nr:unnamed protein product [Spirodela intermedia]
MAGRARRAPPPRRAGPRARTAPRSCRRTTASSPS